jgi:hypothetical protein
MFKEVLQVEKLTASEAVRLLRRDSSTYTKLVIGLYACNSLRGVSFDDARVARAAYFYARHIDDALDDENSNYENNAASPDQLPVEVDKLDSSDHRIAKLGLYAVKGLLARGMTGDEPNTDMQRLIDSMVFDYQRAQNGSQFTNETEVLEYFSDAMRGTNLMLIGFGSQIREDTDIPSFASGLGRIYSARDLAEDWSRGIYNIPRDALEVILGETPDPEILPPTDKLIGTQKFIEWQENQLSIAEAELCLATNTVEPLMTTDPGAKVITLLANQAQGYIPHIRQQLANSAVRHL